MEECHSWLSDDERERAGRFHFERDRVRYISARGGLRHILGRYLGIKPCKIAFRYAVAGKPALALSHHSAVRFNVSHSEGLVLYAFSVEQDVGVDVERVRLVEEAGAILARHFSAETLGRWRTLAAEERPAAFLRIWVEAEAGAKQTGRGIAELGEHHRTVGGDRVRGFVPAPGYVGALAWEGPQHDQ